MSYSGFLQALLDKFFGDQEGGREGGKAYLHDIVHDLLHVQGPHHVGNKLRVGVRLADLGVKKLADGARELGAVERKEGGGGGGRGS